MNRDSRLKPDRGETGTGSIGEADESGGARSAIAQPQPTNPKTPNTHIARIVEGTCPDCDGEGWTIGIGYEDHCCGRSDWECGASGCTGPVQEMVQIQEQCERCRGSGSVRTYLESMEGGNG